MAELNERTERARVLLHQVATDIIGAFNATDDLLGAGRRRGGV